MTTHAHLPNAKHIDRVLASLKANPEKWNAAWDASNDATRPATCRDARADHATAWSVAREMTWNVTQEAARGAACNTARESAWGAAWGAIIALMAYDDCAYMLDSDVGELKIIAAFGDPRAILMLPACMVFNELKI